MWVKSEADGRLANPKMVGINGLTVTRKPLKQKSTGLIH